MSIDKRTEFLQTLPTEVLANYILDTAVNEIGMHASTFALGMQPILRKTTSLELFDFCTSILRQRAALKEQEVKAERGE